jgi:hypothetical protein
MPRRATPVEGRGLTSECFRRSRGAVIGVKPRNTEVIRRLPRKPSGEGAAAGVWLLLRGLGGEICRRAGCGKSARPVG